ncbi:MAG: hypothetical protein LUI12_10085 [Clostridiales bacterium]|nr:hypothetical protein [Clostridiales bacterium]
MELLLLGFILIGIAGVIIYYGGYVILWFLIKSRLAYPVAWFVFSLVVVSHKEWILYTILINSWSAVLWLIVGVISGLMVIVLGIRDVIRFFIPTFRWRDIPNYFFQKKSDKKYEKEFIQYCDLKNKLYHLYEGLEQEEYYFYNDICRNARERAEFDLDWKSYIIELEQSDSFIPFAEWFSKKQRWKWTSYNHEYSEQYKALRRENIKYSAGDGSENS